jgi:hypothetical protein
MNERKKYRVIITVDDDDLREIRQNIAQYRKAGFCWPDESGALDVISIEPVEEPEESVFIELEPGQPYTLREDDFYPGLGTRKAIRITIDGETHIVCPPMLSRAGDTIEQPNPHVPLFLTRRRADS